MKHKVFISWSGDDSRDIAEVFRRWLPLILHNTKPWVSCTDIRSGKRWRDQIARELEACRFGIICVTHENLNRPWLLFEAGALGKTLEATSVCPYLLNVEAKDLSDPLAQFQAATADENGTRSLIVALNESLGEDGVTAENLETTFRRWWPLLNEDLSQVREKASERAHAELELIVDSIPRTQDIVRELKRLGEVSDPQLSRQMVRFSGLLSAFAIGEKEAAKRGQEGKLLLEEKHSLVSLAARGCVVRCIITPPHKHDVIPERVDYLIRRIQCLLDFLEMKNGREETIKAVQNIEWVISPYLQRNTYIIGRLACFDGFKSEVQSGFDLTLRHSRPEAISVNIELYDRLFDHLIAFTRGILTLPLGISRREGLRKAVLARLRESLKTCEVVKRQTVEARRPTATRRGR